MPFELIQIPANGQGNAKEELNQLLRGGRIASVRKEFARVQSVAPDSESGEVARPLERQRQQLPGLEPQQQHPDELEQQHRVTGGPQLRPPGRDGRRLNQGLNRPPSCSSGQGPADETQPVPPDAGRPAEAGSKAPGGTAPSSNPPLF